MTSTVAEGSPALVIIDMQQIFGSPGSEWFVPEYDSAEVQISRLAAHFSNKVIRTRFVRDPDESGSWSAYYDRWSDSREEPDSPVWDLTGAVGESDSVLSLPTFSKWGSELAQLTRDNDHLIICGVATDCCVISTVLGAIDAGKSVTVVTDACAGVTTEAHDQAIGIMELFAPMITFVTTADIVR